MQFNISRFPFSRRGAYLSITDLPGRHCLLLRNCRRLFGEEQFMELSFLDDENQEMPFSCIAEPDRLIVQAGGGQALFAIGAIQEIHGAATNIRIRLTPRGGWNFQVSPNNWRHHVITNCNFTTDTVVHRGTITGQTRTERVNGYHKQVAANYLLAPDDAGYLSFSLVVSPYEVHPSVHEADFIASVTEAGQDWNDFLQTCPIVPERYVRTAELLWYNLWSSYVRSGGHFKYDALLMSKASMCAIWSWDNCFNALALLLGGRLQDALDQFFILFEMQSPEGKLPDFINTEIHWRAAVKPPIHGWCFGLIMDRTELSPDVLYKAYHHLALWTEWHFRYRDTDEDGIPEYIMGNDSGWDNATLFDLGTNMETPDLPAYLYLQMQTLARIAEKLGKADQTTAWQHRSTALLQTFLDHSWQTDRFIARKSGSHIYDPNPTSLMSCMPIVIGNCLPAHMTSLLAEKIRQDFVTPHGVATEAPSSPKYLDNGYWRGPIWAPTTLLVVDGLHRSGYAGLAKKIAVAFCDTVTRSGAYENFDALTGSGLCDMGYTWTSAATLYLMALYTGQPSDQTGMSQQKERHQDMSKQGTVAGTDEVT